MSTTKLQGEARPSRTGVGVHQDRRIGSVDDHQRYTDLTMRRGAHTHQRRTLERGLSRDTGSLKISVSAPDVTFPTALPVLLTMVAGPDRLPVDEDTQEVLRGKLRLLQPDSTEELSSHIHSVSSEENMILLTFKTFDEICKFTTYYSLGFLDQCMESLLLDQKFWINSLDRHHVAMDVSVPEETLQLMFKGLLMQEGSFFASCSTNQIFDSSTSGGDLYLEQGDVAQFEPPFLGSGWSVLSLNDGARGTKLKPALEPVIPFYQWFLKSCPENILVGSGKPVCNFPLKFARGSCVTVAEHHAEGPDELSVAPGDRITAVGLVVSGFDWFLGRAEATGALGLVKTALVEPADNLCESTDIYLDQEERSFFCLKEETIVKETTALLKKASKSDIGSVYQLDLIPQRDGNSFGDADADARLKFKANMERILAGGTVTWPHGEGESETEHLSDITALGDSSPSSRPKTPFFTVQAPDEENPNPDIFMPLLLFLEVADYRPEFGVLSARETARKRRLHWSQSRVCFLLGRLCVGRSKFSQARVYLEEALAVPRDAFEDLRLLAGLYADLAHIYFLQKNTGKHFAAAERLTALVMAAPECVASVKDRAEVLRYTLKKAVLSGNKMAEARACFVLAKCYALRGEDTGTLPYVERLLDLAAEVDVDVSPGHVYLGLGRIYGRLSLPGLGLCAARRAALQPTATLSDCLGGLALALGNSGGPGRPRGREQEEGHTLTLCLSRLLREHGEDADAIEAVRAFVGRPGRALGLGVTERRGVLVWLAWLHICHGQEDAALDVLDTILESLPEHCTSPQEGLVLNMRGIALRRQGGLRRAAESYQAADQICEEFEDLPNWAVAQANFGLLCLKAGAKALAELHLTRLGGHYVTLGRVGDATGCYEWALLLAIKAGQSDCQLTATQHLCHLYGEVSPDQARCIVYTEHQLHLLAARGDRSREGDVLQTVSQLYLSLGTDRAYRAALDSTKRSLGIFIDLGQREKEAYAWLQAGNIYHLLGQKELVDLYIQVAQDVGLITGDTCFILTLLEAAGDVFFNSSEDRDKAVCFYRDRALPIALKTGSTRVRLRLCHKLVSLLLSFQRYEDAVEYAQTALEISITLEDCLSERVSYHRLASIYQQLGRSELAEHHYLRALSLCPAELQFDEETLYYAQVYQTLGDIIFYDLKDPHDAAGYYHLALAAAVDLGNKRAQLRLCTRLAAIYHNYLADRRLSLSFYQRARAFATELNQSADAEPKAHPKCPARCDVSTCPSPSCSSGYVPDSCNCCLGHRVCGGDGRTYVNPCRRRVASREALQQGLPGVEQAHKGPCENSTGVSHPTSPRYKFNFIADVVEKIAPAVVHIELFLRHPLFARTVPLSSGSGFVMSDTGLIVTNAHVVSSATAAAGQQQLKVQMCDGDVYEAKIKDIDKKSDIATIKIHPLKRLSVLSLGHSADLRPGEFVVAIGSPFSLQNTVTTGIVSTAQRDGKELGIRDSDMDYIQTDAIINYGNSGGPLVNLDGEVIGINTLKVAAGISFAIPSDRITRFLNESMDKHRKDARSIKKRFIGIRMLTITPTLVEELKHQNPDFPEVSQGIYVHEVVPQSPAQKGGIRDGDIIVKLNGRPLMTTADLQGALLEETALLLEVRRGNDDLLFNIEPDLIMQ
ncbi:hypothetical protein NHX12_014478 [Muraenolepis orangiensis]|uniref:Serine protease HTRA3 n=1 Tax=Muraenolepis orangiensis TaxID=630683 RepID=A0A9Q0I4N5_9TELE|nr:hypothetical protein NHX12_014478 [Muraenolepis orangiensis]